jgi:hydrogenase maturation protein HypF
VTIVSHNNVAATPPSDQASVGTGAIAASCFILTGGVQGLGVRPAISRLATRLGLAGTVRNTCRGVEIDIEGPHDRLKEFARLLPNCLPKSALVSQLNGSRFAPRGLAGFTIIKEPKTGPLSTRVPPDRGICSECLQEIFAHNDRRHLYPFTSCTQCGPRYTVIRSMPFERADTTMADFALCGVCRQEYDGPADRRFHAQTTACAACGPQVWSVKGSEKSKGEHAIQTAIRSLKAGQIVAIRGLGGYQLLVDATNQSAVERLRERKGRPAKPLAVMVESTEAARRLAFFDAHEIAAFEDSSAPIVLVRANARNGLAPAIHPHLDSVGLMRPTTPLHAMLARDVGRPLVCTSGNREGEPLQFVVESSEKLLAGIADVWLHHDRPIARPIDDSVMRIIADRRVTLRLARGIGPLGLELPTMGPTVALGGFLKAAAAWSNGAQSVLGPHVGDQQGLAARERFVAQLKDWLKLYRFQPVQLVHDMHPEYFSTQWAQKQSISQMAVQHHHAHVVAGMLEHGLLDRKVLGVAWDGTGYGTDDTIWGGEFMACTASAFERVARIRPFSLPGGEVAIHEPWRIAMSVCSQLDGAIDLARWPGWNVHAGQMTSVAKIISRPKLSPITSSAGRLIDAAAALILGVDRSEFDGQPAMRLEAAADRDARGWYHFPVSDEALSELDWRPLFVELVADCRRGVDPGVISMRFHRSLAHGIIGICRRWDELPVVLAGGVFQNRLLAELVAEMIDSKSQPLGLPGLIPPNDGGLAAGQLAISAAKRRG